MCLQWGRFRAYLRVVREFTQGLLRLLPSVRDYSAWAHRYYSRLVIRVITREGFAPPLLHRRGGQPRRRLRSAALPDPEPRPHPFSAH